MTGPQTHTQHIGGAESAWQGCYCCHPTILCCLLTQHTLLPRMQREKGTHESKGSAFIWFATLEAAEAAVKQFNHKHALPDPTGMQMRALVVRRANKRKWTAADSHSQLSSGSNSLSQALAQPAAAAAAQAQQQPSLQQLGMAVAAAAASAAAMSQPASVGQLLPSEFSWLSLQRDQAVLAPQTLEQQVRLPGLVPGCVGCRGVCLLGGGARVCGLHSAAFGLQQWSSDPAAPLSAAGGCACWVAAPWLAQPVGDWSAQHVLSPPPHTGDRGAAAADVRFAALRPPCRACRLWQLLPCMLAWAAWVAWLAAAALAPCWAYRPVPAAAAPWPC